MAACFQIAERGAFQSRLFRQVFEAEAAFGANGSKPKTQARGAAGIFIHVPIIPPLAEVCQIYLRRGRTKGLTARHQPWYDAGVPGRQTGQAQYNPVTLTTLRAKASRVSRCLAKPEHSPPVQATGRGEVAFVKGVLYGGA